MTQKYAVVDPDGLVTAFYSDDINPVIPEEAVAISDEVWSAWLQDTARQAWDGSALIAYTPPAPVLSLAPITKRQMLLWLLAHKNKSEADILAAIGTIANATAKAEAQIAWNYPDGGILHRANPLFDQLASQFQMTGADIDAAFAAAALL